MLDELLILKKIKGGDIKAFEELFRRYYFPLCCYAAGIIGQMEVAEEIVEELFYCTLERKGALTDLSVR
jgi:Sig70_bacteroi1: RNA polymerase sigma-70 factor, Bacteroides expansion family 1